MESKKYEVTGMSCAACSARVEKAVSGVPGVTSCSVSLLTNSMAVEGGANDNEIISAVEAAGYGAKPMKDSAEEQLRALTEGNPKKIKNRLIISIILLIFEMYLSMGVAMLHWPVPPFIDRFEVMWCVVAALTLAVMIINRRFFINGFKGLIHRTPNMDTLVAMGSFASFAYSSVFLVKALAAADAMSEMSYYMDNFFFDSAAMILVLITVGKMLETRSKGKTTDALKSLMKLAPKTAVILDDETEKEVPVEAVKAGDIFVVRPGGSIPVDGIVTEGESAVNEAMLTGESLPVDKKTGDEVSSGTINTSGYIKCRALRVGRDTALSQIIKLVSDSASTKAPTAKIADTVSGIFVPVVIGIGLVTFAVWMLLGETVGFALARAISVLVVSCPCALGLATPVAIMVGNGVAAKNQILFKTSAALEECGRIEIVALDKTGTVTTGEPAVTDIVPANGVSETELLSLAVSLEAGSEHPLAKAVVGYADEKGIKPAPTTDFAALSGSGVRAAVSGKSSFGGNAEYIGSTISDKALPTAALETGNRLSGEGKTPLYFSSDGRYMGMIAVADVIKADAKEAVRQLGNMGTAVCMLTGDNERTAKAVAGRAGIKNVAAGIKPDEKAKLIGQLKKYGKTAMAGDGINDAPALTIADVGIAIGAGTDVAIDAASVVLMKSSPLDIAAAVRLSRKTLRIIHQNLFWAFCYNLIGIPLAAGVFIPINGWMLTPMFGAAVMSISSFLVVSNALRIGAGSIYDGRRDKIRKAVIERIDLNVTSGAEDKEEKTMTKTVTIEGMMCTHCSGHVRDTLTSLDGVESAEVSHETGKAVISLSAEVEAAQIQKAVENAGYKFISME
ncbi:MAG: heavy metal translocating P-type ATPase [Lachnospiraceae bacterium]|nr:heavy metal translocating P-type ATPase [Lachnospiraceae bacterium]